MSAAYHSCDTLLRIVLVQAYMFTRRLSACCRASHQVSAVYLHRRASNTGSVLPVIIWISLYIPGQRVSLSHMSGRIAQQPRVRVSARFEGCACKCGVPSRCDHSAYYAVQRLWQSVFGDNTNMGVRKRRYCGAPSSQTDSKTRLFFGSHQDMYDAWGCGYIFVRLAGLTSARADRRGRLNAARGAH